MITYEVYISKIVENSEAIPSTHPVEIAYLKIRNVNNIFAIVDDIKTTIAKNSDTPEERLIHKILKTEEI